MKRILFSTLGTISIFALSYTAISHAEDALPLYKETNRYIVYCMSSDQKNADIMIEKGEAFIEELSNDFKHTYSKKMNLYIYPDLVSFHKAINSPNAPDWVIGCHGGNISKIVSPSNPGPVHSYESILLSERSGLVTAYIYDKYSNNDSIPRWLHQGVALYKAGFYSPEKVTLDLTHDIAKLPSLEQLESIKKEDNALTFSKVNGFYVSFSLVEFIIQKWGWESVLNLLENYSNFEKVFGLSKKEFQEQWLEFLRNYPA